MNLKMVRRPASMKGGLHCLCFLLLAVFSSSAQARLQVSYGWGGKDRAGRWNPVIVTISDPVPRNAILELNLPREDGYATVIREQVAIGPRAATFEMQVPARYGSGQRGVMVLRDARSGRTLAQVPAHTLPAKPSIAQLGPQGLVIGVSGKRALLADLTQGSIVAVGYLPMRLLPRNPIGYDSLETLFLNQADLDDLDADQQRAILSWVRAGGSLLLTPGDTITRSTSQLADALPCRIGLVSAINLSLEVLRRTGLKNRFAHLTGRVLEPRAAARAIELVDGGHVTGWWRRYGLGRMLVAPIDLADLEFEATLEKQSAPAFWNPIIAQLATAPLPLMRTTFDAPFNGRQSESEDQQREGAAIGTLCDLVDAAPDAGPWVNPGGILILLLILLVIGPVDSLALVAAGQRPLTWIPTGGWIGLIVIGSIQAASLLQRDRVELRTVRVIDQMDGTTVASADLVGLYSAQGTSYAMDPVPWINHAPRGWWQPAAPGLDAPENVRAQIDFRFHQTDVADVPEPVRTNAGLTRFARSQTQFRGPPVIEAALSLRPRALSPKPPTRASSLQLVGTITNLSDRAMTNLHVRTRHGVVAVPLAGGGLLPGHSIQVDLRAAGEAFPPSSAQGRYQDYGYFGGHHSMQALHESELWAVAPDLSGRRSMRIDQALGEGHFVCIYAQSVDPPQSVALSGNVNAVGRRYQWVRALIAIK